MREKEFDEGLEKESNAWGPVLLPITQMIKGSQCHYYYGSPDESYFIGDCGPLAAKRLAFHAMRLGVIKDDPRRHTVMWLRGLLAGRSSTYARRGTALLPEHLMLMLRALGVPQQHIRVVSVGGDDDPELAAARRMGLLEAGVDNGSSVKRRRKMTME